MGYQIPIFREYVKKYDASVSVVYWDHKKKTPYQPPSIDNVTFYKKSIFQKTNLAAFVADLQPHIVYISGWMDRDYLSAVKILRKRGIPVVSGFDDIWYNTLRQRVASWMFPLIKHRYFSHAWVAGPYQYEFAKNIGFKNNQIIFNCLSADIEIFNSSYNHTIEAKAKQYTHRFLYAGRFESIKGVDLLLDAWSKIKTNKKNWDLCLIGNGALSTLLKNESEIVVKEFMQPEQLAGEIAESGCFVLPSRKDQWGLVLHEFSAAGLPIICSDACGAAPVFVTPGFNGYLFKSNDANRLAEKMIRIINTDDRDLAIMSRNSHQNGQKITPEMSAASFLSILDL